jgi:hypothetical protein
MIHKAIIVASFFLFSMACNAKKKVKTPIPQYVIEFNQHFSNQDIDGILLDYEKFPQLRERIMSYLLYETDYRKVSYGKVKSLRDKCKRDSVLFEGMNMIVANKEYEILYTLSEKTIPYIANYYKRCPMEEHEFLMPILRNLYADNIEKYGLSLTLQMKLQKMNGWKTYHYYKSS